MTNIKRYPTYINELDDAILGGFPGPSSYLVLGSPGVGKTLWMLSIAVKQAQNGYASVFLALDTSIDIINEIISSLSNQNLDSLKVVDYYSWRMSKSGAAQISNLANLADNIDHACRDVAMAGKEITYVFIDSLTTLIAYNQTPSIYKFTNHLKGPMHHHKYCFFGSLDEGAQPKDEQTLIEQCFDGTVRFSQRADKRYFSIPRIHLTPPLPEREFKYSKDEGFVFGASTGEEDLSLAEVEEEDMLDMLRGL